MSAELITAGEAPPDWWGHCFSVRQERIRSYLRRKLRQLEDGDGLPEAHFFAAARPKYDFREIEAAVYALVSEGALKVEVKYGRDRLGRRVKDHWYYPGPSL